MKKIAIIFSLGLASLNAHSADVPVATDTGTITVKGSVYTAACTSSGLAATIAIPTTFTTDYSKGDMSPEGTSGIAMVVCPGVPDMGGVYITVTGDADGTEPSLFKVADGTGKATGVAIKLTAKSAYASANIIDIIPNQESIIMPRATSANSTGWYYLAQAVAVDDKVTSGDLSTNLTWTARYN